MSAFDVAIVGLGAMGSAAAHHAAARGLSVVGFDRFTPPHAHGSSHGETRIIREAYFEDPRYVPLVQRAYDLWLRLERDSGRRLMVRTGGVVIGPPDGTLLRGALASAALHRLPCERLDAAAVRERFPALAPGEGMAAVWEPRAGMLFPEDCVAAHLERAAEDGADLRRDEPVTAWRATGGGFEVETPKGRVAAGGLVLAANAWLPRLLGAAAPPLTVTRQPLFWFQPRANTERFEPSRLGVYLWEPEPGAFFYGFPAVGGLVKVAPHGGGAETDPDRVDRAVADAEIGAMRARLERWMPDAAGRFVRAAVCLYANTPDGHFVIDRLPDHENAIVVSACSGHGFKFSSAIGEAAVQLLADGGTPHDLGLFRWRWS